MSNLPEYDQLQAFIFENMPIRGAIVRLHATYQVALSKQPYPPVAQHVLGDALTLVTLLTHTVKLEGSLSLQAHGEGPVTLLMSECTHDLHLRGIVHYKEPLMPGPLPDLFGKGVMAITMNAENQPHNYQGIIPLQGNNLGQAVEHYFAQSEQLPTRLYLGHDSLSTVGLLLQAIPGHETAEGEMDWEHVIALADTLKPEELLSLNNREILHRLYHQEVIRLFESQPVSFRCSCSRSKMESVMLSLGKDELLSILDEYGTVDTFCEFCNHHYLFDAVDIHKLLADPDSHFRSPKEH